MWTDEYDYLAELKTLAGITDDSSDARLKLMIFRAKQMILNYCNLKSIPEGLTSCVVALAFDAWVYLQSTGGESTGNVSSISEDGRTVSFGVSSAADAVNAFLADSVAKMTELKRYRKLYRL